MKITRTFATAAFATTLVVGGSTAAFAAGSGDATGGGLRADKIAVLCEHQDEIVPRLTERQTELTERIATLTELHTKATAADKTKAAEKIGKRISKLQQRLDTITTRIADAPAWIAGHCNGA